MTLLFHRLCAAYRVLGGLLVLALIGVLLAGIAMREIFSKPLVWVNEVSLILFLWTVFVGAGVAFADNARIRFTLLTSLLPEGLRRTADRAVTLVGVGLLCLFLWVSLKMLRTFSGQRLVSLDLPVAVEWLALPVGLLLAILALLRFVISPPLDPTEPTDTPAEAPR
ncbi:TRAP transporter small permease [uncultured Jannaschia sp.]|uniref:TRAP transporter small permease n=1 Tax=uncultured Jannaschia sp. TaxID=293347 RepID=UPI00261434CD|nr:TRAP transporter small permease [uncultured Jannaschia sp.]